VQLAQGAEPAAAVTRPAGQLEQAIEPEADDFPAAQLPQLALPDAEEYRPALQLPQLALPDAAEYRPALQLPHAPEPLMRTILKMKKNHSYFNDCLFCRVHLVLFEGKERHIDDLQEKRKHKY
jgi:hypothetical protein